MNALGVSFFVKGDKKRKGRYCTGQGCRRQIAVGPVKKSDVYLRSSVKM